MGRSGVIRWGLGRPWRARPRHLQEMDTFPSRRTARPGQLRRLAAQANNFFQFS